MRVRHTVNPVVSEDANGRSVLFGLDEQLADAVIDGFTRVNSGVTDLSDTDVYNIPLGDVTDARGIFLRSDGGDFDVVINGSDTPLQVRRGVTGEGGALFQNCKLLIECNVATVEVTAVGDGRLTYCIWGDPVA